MQSNDDKDMTKLRQRALYRAFYRGTKEMDFLLGRFAKEQVQHMGREEIQVFERLMEIPEPILTGALVDKVGEFEAETEALLERIRQFHKK